MSRSNSRTGIFECQAPVSPNFEVRFRGYRCLTPASNCGEKKRSGSQGHARDSGNVRKVESETRAPCCDTPAEQDLRHPGPARPAGSDLPRIFRPEVCRILESR